jgi:hypothetical protein
MLGSAHVRSRKRLAMLVGCSLLVAIGSGLSARAAPFPDTIHVPDGAQPEGIAIAPDGTLFVGSLIDGTISRGTVRSDTVEPLVTPPAGRISVGMKVHRGFLFVAGGPTPSAVYDAATGDEVEVYAFSPGGFVNDVVVTKDAAWFTDSFVPVLYRVPIAHDGTPGDPSSVEVLPLTGDLQFGAGFNTNGIVATANGSTLMVVQSNTGTLFTVDPSTGFTTRIDLRGETVDSGDGLVRVGPFLYVVQNGNLVTKVRLDPGLTSGRVLSRTTDDDFDVTTTAARFGDALFVVNARFEVTPTPDTPYWIAVIRRP